MSKLIRHLLIAIHVGIVATIVSPASYASSPFCLVGCVKADVAGLTDIANALKQWAELLPQLNEDFHKEIRNDLSAMDNIAVNLIDKLDRTYGDNLDLTSDTVKSLIRDAVQQINSIGENALVTYRKFLYETDCGVQSVASIIKRNISESIPRFQWIRENLFGERFNVLELTDFSGKIMEENFDPNSDSERFLAAYRLFTRKIQSAQADTKMISLLNVSLERQILAFQYHCETRAAIGEANQFGHIFNLLRDSRVDYVNLFYVYNFEAGR